MNPTIKRTESKGTTVDSDLERRDEFPISDKYVRYNGSQGKNSNKKLFLCYFHFD